MQDVLPVEEYVPAIVNEEYKIWKKHVPFLYNVLHVYELPTNSNTFRWMPTPPDAAGDSLVYQCLIGSNSTSNNHLSVVNVCLPTADTICDMTEYKVDADLGPGEMGLRLPNFETQIQQPSQIMRARLNPSNHQLVASKCGGNNPELLIVNLAGSYSMTNSNNNSDDNSQNLFRLQGHSAEGFGLDWNTHKSNLLLSGSSDKKICIWDIESDELVALKSEMGDESAIKTLEPIEQLEFHSQAVEDVNWNKMNPNVFASCGQDRLIAVWDIRQNKKKPQMHKLGHVNEIYSLDFSPYSEYLLLSASQDSEIGLWDIRNISKRVHTMSGHHNSVNVVRWSPSNRTLFASGSSDRRVIVWDIAKVGETNEHGEPAETVFIHAGHRSKVLDLDWGVDGLTIGSVQEANSMQVWRINEAVTKQYTEQ